MYSTVKIEDTIKLRVCNIQCVAKKNKAMAVTPENHKRPWSQNVSLGKYLVLLLFGRSIFCQDFLLGFARGCPPQLSNSSSLNIHINSVNLGEISFKIK